MKRAQAAPPFASSFLLLAVVVVGCALRRGSCGSVVPMGGRAGQSWTRPRQQRRHPTPAPYIPDEAGS